MIRKTAVGFSCLFLFAACANGVDGADGANGANGANGIGAAVRVSAVAPGADCAGGGQRIDIGRDDGEGGGTAGNGTLEDGEVDESTFVCDGADGAPGADGDDGAPGDDGFNALLALTAVGPPECHLGGQRVAAGLDNGDGEGIARNGILEEGEVDQVSLACTAGSVAVPNGKFEDNPNVNGQTTEADGWTSNGAGGLEIGTGFTNPDGQYYFVNLAGFGGVNPSFTQSNAGLIGETSIGTYTLTVALGRRNNDATTDGAYVIELLSDDVVIGTETVNDPFTTFASDTFNDVSAVAVIAPDDVTIGGDLSVRLTAIDGTGNPRSQGQFDNVRLDYRR